MVVGRRMVVAGTQEVATSVPAGRHSRSGAGGDAGVKDLAAMFFLLYFLFAIHKIQVVIRSWIDCKKTKTN